MNANEVIECYITDVAVQLPRGQRNDVALELRSLLAEGLQDQADAAGRETDAAMAVAFLRGFGSPAEVAARYRPTLTVVDPVDGPAFMRAMMIGLVVIWIAGLLSQLQQPVESDSGALRFLGQWWTGTLIPSLWWPGALVVGFAISSWLRRRRPKTAEWNPKSNARIVGSRATLVLGVIGVLCGVYVLLDPRWILDLFWGGQAAPAAYQALTYTESFRQRQAPLLFVLLALYVPLYITVIAQGRWTTLMRRLETMLGLLLFALMAWVVLDGPVFLADASDRAMKFCMVLIIAFSLIAEGIRRYRGVRPAADRSLTAPKRRPAGTWQQ